MEQEFGFEPAIGQSGPVAHASDKGHACISHSLSMIFGVAPYRVWGALPSIRLMDRLAIFDFFMQCHILVRRLLVSRHRCAAVS